MKRPTIKSLSSQIAVLTKQLAEANQSFVSANNCADQYRTRAEECNDTLRRELNNSRAERQQFTEAGMRLDAEVRDLQSQVIQHKSRFAHYLLAVSTETAKDVAYIKQLQETLTMGDSTAIASR